MIFELTTAGLNAINATPGVPPVLSLAKLGSGYNYVPASTDVALHGTLVHTTTPSPAQTLNSNVLVYTVYLDPSVGPFNFGEIGLFLPGNVLFALGSSSSLVTKVQNTQMGNGNSIKIDCYVSSVGSTHDMYASLTNDEDMKLNAAGSVDSLPNAYDVEPNVFVVPHPAFQSQSILASAYNSLWSLSEYTQPVGDGFITGVSPTMFGVTYTALPMGAEPTLTYPGYLVIQFLTGAAAGNMRVVSSTTPTYIGINNALYNAPAAGDLFQILACTALSTHSTNFLAGLDPQVTAQMINDLVINNNSVFLERDGSLAMQGNLNMGGNKVIGVGVPTGPNDAVNLQTLLDAVAAIQPPSSIHLADGSVDTTNTSTSTLDPNQSLDSISAAEFRSAAYYIQATSGSEYQITQLLAIHDGVDAHITEYGTLFTGLARIASFDADIISGNLVLQVTPNASPMNIKVMRSSLVV